MTTPNNPDINDDVITIRKSISYTSILYIVYHTVCNTISCILPTNDWMGLRVMLLYISTFDSYAETPDITALQPLYPFSILTSICTSNQKVCVSIDHHPPLIV